MTSRFALLTKQDKYSKASKKRLKTRTHKHKKVDEGGKGAVCWLREREKTERTWGKEKVSTNFENILCRSEKEKIRSMYNKTIIRFGFCDIHNNQGLGKALSIPTSTLIILDITKTSSSNCLLFVNFIKYWNWNWSLKKYTVYFSFAPNIWHHSRL